MIGFRLNHWLDPIELVNALIESILIFIKIYIKFNENTKKMVHPRIEPMT